MSPFNASYKMHFTKLQIISYINYMITGNYSKSSQQCSACAYLPPLTQEEPDRDFSKSRAVP